MSKGNTWQKNKMAKHRDNQNRYGLGGFTRFSFNGVETKEARGQWFDGPGGNWHDVVPASEPVPEDRRDGGSKPIPTEHKMVVPNYDATKVARVASRKEYEHKLGKRVNLGTPLINASWSYKPGAQWEIVRK